MCGIAGIMGRKNTLLTPRLIDVFDQSLTHRGPDGRGDYTAANVAMIQRRLAIIDLKTGDQPLYSGSNETPTALIGNGEIYNYIELRREFSGFPFRTHSDCETPLALYSHKGLSFPERLRGMYALAIHDTAAQRLILSRDPFGIKQLYVIETDAGLAFASEPQALIAAGLAPLEIDSTKRHELLQLNFTTGSDTIFKSIRRLLPGETIVVDDGRIVSHTHEPAFPLDPPIAISAQDALKKLDHTLEQAVDVHQRSDVPYAMFLSGGIDSSALLAMMARLNDQPVTTFTAGFPGTNVADERNLARDVAKACNAEVVDVSVTAEDFWNYLPAIVAGMDDPVADYAIIPTWLLAKTARDQGFKVVLSGEGGDEIFAGYGRYRAALRPWPFKKAMRSRGIFDGLDLLKPNVTANPKAWRDNIAASERAFNRRNLTPLQRLQALDCVDWLPHDLLIKLDRCLMAHGVEGRTPFLDKEVAQFAFTLPDNLKLHRGMGKWILREWLAKHLPVAQPFSRKRGFTVPVGPWMAERGKMLGDAMARQAAIKEIARIDDVRNLYADPRLATDQRFAQAGWSLLFYALWHRRHIQGLKPDGGILDCLTARLK